MASSPCASLSCCSLAPAPVDCIRSIERSLRRPPSVSGRAVGMALAFEDLSSTHHPEGVQRHPKVEEVLPLRLTAPPSSRCRRERRRRPPIPPRIPRADVLCDLVSGDHSMAHSTAVLVHGGWGNPTDWRFVERLLVARSVTVVAPDLPSRRSASATRADDVAFPTLPTNTRHRTHRTSRTTCSPTIRPVCSTTAGG